MSIELDFPELIQGGMGVNVSNENLAREVATAGEKLGRKVMGTVSGTGIAIIMARRLQTGDPGGFIRKALVDFPVPEMVEEVLKDWFIEGVKPEDKPFKEVPMVNMNPSKRSQELLICSNYALVKMAQEGHSNPIGINYLEKIQTPRLYELFGAMLAGVDYVLMGAGIPWQVPGVLDRLSRLEEANYYIDVEGANAREFSTRFNPLDLIPERYVERIREQVKRPRFLAIIASNVLAEALVDPKREIGFVNGFIVEGPTAGGHNAPPRGKPQYNERKEPVYGDKDVVDLQRLKKLNKPFYLAGGYASSEKLKEAKELGAQGVQVGTIFAMSRDSGLKPEIREQLTSLAFKGLLKVFTDSKSSPSGFPFKVAELLGTLYEEELYQLRERVCDIGYLRHAYKTARGTVAFRCPSEPVKTFLKKGGRLEDTIGRKCLCNSLVSGVGLPQIYRGKQELPIVTLGDGYSFIKHLISQEDQSYPARDAVGYLLKEEVRLQAA